MSKDFPALRMMIDGGKLVPATPYDQERIDSYRRGTTVFVKFTEEKDRVLVKKWFAVLGLVLKQCRTPWKTRAEAHEAIKLALGIVNLSKTVNGQWLQYPKSLTELDEPELREALDNMIALLSEITGVDVDTLRAEATSVGAETDSGEATPPPASEAEATPSVSTSSENVVSPSSQDDDAEGSETPSSHSEPSPDPMDWLFNVARMLWAAAIPGSDPSVLKAQRVSAAAAYPPEGVPKPVLDKAKSCFDYCMQVVAEELDPETACEIIAGITHHLETDFPNLRECMQ